MRSVGASGFWDGAVEDGDGLVDFGGGGGEGGQEAHDALARGEDEEALFAAGLDGVGEAVPELDSDEEAEAADVLDGGVGFAEAIKVGADSIIVAHNHPSGDPTPSKADYDATAKLNAGASLVGLELMDHLIIGSPESANGLGFVSMAELMDR